MKDIKDLTDDELAYEIMYWFRVGRNENGLQGDERKYFQDLCAEGRSREGFAYLRDRNSTN